MDVRGTNRIMNILVCFIMCVLLCSCHTFDIKKYREKRAELLFEESQYSLGGRTVLTEKEAIVNNCLMQHKFNEYDYAFDNPQYFNFSNHFFTYKDKIPNSKVYKIIKSMPKGAVLHVHDMGILDAEYLLNVTYMRNLYVCFGIGSVNFKFSEKMPNITCDGQWKLMSQARQSAPNQKEFDADLKRHFSIVVDNPDTVYHGIKDTWDAFMKYFKTLKPLLSFRPIWEQYFYDALKKFREDNIMYVEVRSILPNLYELDGTTYDPLITAKAYRKVIKAFVKDHPDFFGAKLIYAPPRQVVRETLTKYLETAKKIKEDMPDTFAGFDLVGQEDLGKPLIEFVPQLLEASKDLNYFFHAGETDWYGTLTDCNLVDAILLGAKRIGHAYALPKHPLLVEEIVQREIALEVNVISNAVLSLVRDIRNHPLSFFISEGLPVVLSSDDPGAWGADSISDDYYVAFVAVASRLSDLRLLKTLVMNTVKYSTLQDDDKTKAMRKLEVRWNHFVNTFNCSNY